MFPEPAEEANMDRNPRPCVSALFFLSPLLYFTLPEPLKAQLAGETVMTVHGLVFMGGMLGSVSTEMSPRARTAGTPKGPSTISSHPSLHSMENGSPEESGVWQGSHTWLLPMAELRAPPKVRALPEIAHLILTCSPCSLLPSPQERMYESATGPLGETSGTKWTFCSLNTNLLRDYSPEAGPCLAHSSNYPTQAGTLLSQRQKDDLLCQGEKLPRNYLLSSHIWANTLQKL